MCYVTTQEISCVTLYKKVVYAPFEKISELESRYAGFLLSVNRNIVRYELVFVPKINHLLSRITYIYQDRGAGKFRSQISTPAPENARVEAEICSGPKNSAPVVGDAELSCIIFLAGFGA